MNEIGRRVEATIATQAKFKDKPFDWTKAATCIHLARYHAAKMGHKLPIVPRFRSVLGAKKALRDVGFDSLPDLLDSYFTRIPPAFMQVGDLLALEGEHGWHSLVVKGDRSKFLGWHEDAIGCTIMDIDLSVAEGGVAAMSKTIGKIGKIVISPISLVIGDKATSALLTIAAMIPGPHQPFAAAAAAAFTMFSQMSAPSPVARGSLTSVLIESEPARPYMVGESFSAGVLRHQTGYGATLKKVPNPYLLQIKVFSGVGPVESLVQEQFDYEAIGSYYDDFYDSVSQLGARPESAALVPPYGTAPGWDSDSKLSGFAAIASNYKFDRDGKVFASGIPPHGAIWQGEMAYDPRKDDTYPGGSGDHRLGTESTYEYTTNPALHMGTYAYGRYQNGKLIFGLGLDEAGIDWAAIVDWANDCDTNVWECHGTLWEGGKGNDIQTQRIRNMDDLCAAGGGRWLVAGALLSFDWNRSRVPLATLTDDDWLEEGGTVSAVQSLRDRMNGVYPMYISPDHNWEQITAEEIIGSTYRTEDGVPLTQTWALNLVKDEDQAGQLATYAMCDSREIGPFELNVKSEWRFYKPGETITIDSDILGYTGPAVIIQRDFDPDTFAVRLTLKGETAAKHAYALGESATAPATPVIGQTAEERDAVSAYAVNPKGAATVKSFDPLYPIAPGDGEIVITASTAVLDDGRTISLPSQTESSLAVSTKFYVFWDLVDEEYVFSSATQPTQLEDSRYVFLSTATTSSGGTYPTPTPTPPGTDGMPSY